MVTGVKMPIRIPKGMAYLSLFSLLLSGCFSPPHNNFQEDQQRARHLATYSLLGIGAGTVISGFSAVGGAIGGAAGIGIAQYKNRKQAIINELRKQDIEVITYGDTMTLLVPTDRYFIFNSAHLNDVCYQGLNAIVRLIKYHSCGPIYVAGFTDNVGTRYHKNKLSQAQAEAMLTFLWAYGIPAQRFRAEGYGDKHAIGDNHLIHGSAYNRRIEIQWMTAPSQMGASCVPYRVVDSKVAAILPPGGITK
jgi:outer membrane protein OmpA-like peptidoglycan-associated protein